MLRSSLLSCAHPLCGLALGLLGLILIQEISAQPLSRSSAALSKRHNSYFPNYEECEKAIKPNHPPPNSAIFVTNLPKDPKTRQIIRYRITKWATEFKLSTIFGGNSWVTPSFTDTRNYIGSKFEDTEFWDNVSRVWASRASGKVFLIMPYNEEPSNGPFWNAVWPAIQRNEEITEVIWVNMDPFSFTSDIPSILDDYLMPDPSTVTKTWWRRGSKLPATWRKWPPMTTEAQWKAHGLQISRIRPVNQQNV